MGEVKTYKTSDATSTSEAKQPVLKLAGNSITKVRVYIWLEGQDIDNYDIISKNPSVKIKFGLTKDRYGIDDTNNTSINTRASSFQDDSWAKIKSNIQNENTSQYNVGDMRTIRTNGKEYKLRLVNKSTNSNCSNTSYSQTACGFVVEFVDVIWSQSSMNTSATNRYGWNMSNIRTNLRDSIYNNLPSDLKSVITSTRVISGHGSSDSSNHTSTDNLYLLSGVEIFGADDLDTAASATRQLDYYVGKSNSDRIKSYQDNNQSYWLRTAISNNNNSFRTVSSNGTLSGDIAFSYCGLAPAFRIG